MNIHILVENNPGDKCAAEHGLSLFLEVGEVKILFDTGQSSLFIKNAVEMGIDVNSAHFVVLSHGHYDHGNGLSYLINKELICHVGCFVERFRKSDDEPIGLPLTLQQAQERFSLRMTDSPVEIYQNIFFMGGIPRVFDFEESEAFSYLIDGSDDPILDDSALVVKSSKGNIIITGCSHAGICNIIERATNITRDVRTYAIIGGFHLKEVNERVMETIGFLGEIGVEKIYPIHCTNDIVVEAFKAGLPNTQVNSVKAGDSITIIAK